MPDVILFVEDNVDFRDTATRFLELSKFEVLVAGDGQEALEILEKSAKKPDIIISDIAMPRMDGRTFFDTLNQKPEFRTVPFIFLTAYDGMPDQLAGLQSGADLYLVKPFRPEDLLKVIQARLYKNRNLMAGFEAIIQNIRTEIIRVLSHELRTPLTHILGAFCLLESELGQDAETQKLTNLMYKGIGRIQRLSDQMVLLAELMNSYSHKSWEHLITSVNLYEVIQTAIKEVREFATERSTEIIFEGDYTIFLNGVHSLLVNAIREPLHNAIMYSPHNAKVYIRAFKNDDKAIIEIQDYGRGIPIENLDTVWKPMMQSEREKYEQQGFGLGLTITKHAIEVHQGQVTLESEVDYGTVVRLTLPIEEIS